jgi:type II secretory ATPase GspE/PulE/Tfp pilus assembly ATPase PilB-like protein
MSDASENRALAPPDLTSLDVEQGVLALIRYAAGLPASDLFLAANENDAAISVRHMGIVRPLLTVGPNDITRYINHVKAMAGMPVDQRLRPLDGRWVCNVDEGRRVDLRINTIPTLWGEDMAIRLLEHDLALLELENLGFQRRNLDQLMSLLSRPSGLILVTGPAGAGKTTTLYACLSHLNDGSRKINTIEDPVELAMPGIRQSEVRPRIDLDFPELIRSVLRQAPDVIMVGEIRDPITAETAVLAANSGHLVFATLHSPTAAGAVNSMLALGANPHFLSACLLGVLSQRLVRRLCDQCKVAFDLTGSPHTFDDVRAWLKPGEGENIYSSRGCEACRFEGFSGRTGVAEVLRVSRAIRGLIHERQPTREIRQKAVEEGMLDLRRAALLKVAQGITSTEEVIRTIPAEHLLPDE